MSIQAPRTIIFEFVLEPKNTQLWIDSAGEETIDTDQIKIGTKYTNNYGTLEVTDYEKDSFFELKDERSSYECSYSFRKLSETETQLVYFESMLDGSDLANPLATRHFEKLKKLLET